MALARQSRLFRLTHRPPCRSASLLRATGGGYIPHHKAYIRGRVIPQLWSTARQVPFKRQALLYTESAGYHPMQLQDIRQHCKWAAQGHASALKPCLNASLAAVTEVQQALCALWVHIACSWPMWVASAKAQAGQLLAEWPSMCTALRTWWGNLVATLAASCRMLAQPEVWQRMADSLLRSTGMIRMRESLGGTFSKQLASLSTATVWRQASSVSSVKSAAAVAGLAAAGPSPLADLAAASSGSKQNDIKPPGRRWFTQLTDDEESDEFGFSKDRTISESEPMEDLVQQYEEQPQVQLEQQHQQHQPTQWGAQLVVEVGPSLHISLPQVRPSTPFLVGAAALVLVVSSMVKQALSSSRVGRAQEEVSEQLRQMRAEEVTAQRARFRRVLSPTEASGAKAKAQQVVEDWDTPAGAAPAAPAVPPAWNMDPKASREYERFIQASGMGLVTDIWDKSMVEDLPKVSAADMSRMTQQIRDAANDEDFADMASMAERERDLQQQLQQQLDLITRSRRAQQQQQQQKLEDDDDDDDGEEDGRSRAASPSGQNDDSESDSDSNPFAITAEARQQWEDEDHLYSTPNANKQKQKGTRQQQQQSSPLQEPRRPHQTAAAQSDVLSLQYSSSGSSIGSSSTTLGTAAGAAAVRIGKATSDAVVGGGRSPTIGTAPTNSSSMQPSAEDEGPGLRGADASGEPGWITTARRHKRSTGIGEANNSSSSSMTDAILPPPDAPAALSPGLQPRPPYPASRGAVPARQHTGEAANVARAVSGVASSSIPASAEGKSGGSRETSSSPSSSSGSSGRDSEKSGNRSTKKYVQVVAARDLEAVSAATPAPSRSAAASPEGQMAHAARSLAAGKAGARSARKSSSNGRNPFAVDPSKVRTDDDESDNESDDEQLQSHLAKIKIKF